VAGGVDGLLHLAEEASPPLRAFPGPTGSRRCC
jgi:hypothetical protein